jgi:hypothetical protein
VRIAISFNIAVMNASKSILNNMSKHVKNVWLNPLGGILGRSQDQELNWLVAAQEIILLLVAYSPKARLRLMTLNCRDASSLCKKGCFA